MQLVQNTLNGRWGFLFAHRTLARIERDRPWPYDYPTREEALQAAARAGIRVDEKGGVFVPPCMTKNEEQERIKRGMRP